MTVETPPSELDIRLMLGIGIPLGPRTSPLQGSWEVTSSSAMEAAAELRPFWGMQLVVEDVYISDGQVTDIKYS